MSVALNPERFPSVPPLKNIKTNGNNNNEANGHPNEVERSASLNEKQQNSNSSNIRTWSAAYASSEKNSENDSLRNDSLRKNSTISDPNIRFLASPQRRANISNTSQISPSSDSCHRPPPPTTRKYSPYTKTLGRINNREKVKLITEESEDASGEVHQINLSTILNRPLTQNGLRRLRSKSLPGFPSWLLAIRASKNNSNAKFSSTAVPQRSPSTIAVGLNVIPSLPEKKDSKHLLFSGSITQCGNEEGNSSDTDSVDESTASSSEISTSTLVKSTNQSPRPYLEIPISNLDSDKRKKKTSEISSPRESVEPNSDSKASPFIEKEKLKKKKRKSQTKGEGKSKEKLKEKKPKRKEGEKTKSPTDKVSKLPNSAPQSPLILSSATSGSTEESPNALLEGRSNKRVRPNIPTLEVEQPKEPSAMVVVQSKPGQRSFVTAFDWIKSFAAGQAEFGDPQLDSSESDDEAGGYNLEGGSSDEDYDEEELALLSDTDDVFESDGLDPTPSITTGSGLLTPTFPSSIKMSPRIMDGQSLSPTSISHPREQQPISPRSTIQKQSMELNWDGSSSESIQPPIIAVSAPDNRLNPLADAFLLSNTNGSSDFGSDFLKISSSTPTSTKRSSRRKTDRSSRRQDETPSPPGPQSSKEEKAPLNADSERLSPKRRRRSSSKPSTSKSPEPEGRSKEKSPLSTRTVSPSSSKASMSSKSVVSEESTKQEPSTRKKRESLSGKAPSEGKSTSFGNELTPGNCVVEPWKKSPDIVKLRKRSLRMAKPNVTEAAGIQQVENKENTELKPPMATSTATEPEEYEENGVRWMKTIHGSKVIVAISLENILSIIFEGDWIKERSLREEFLLVMPFFSSAASILEGIASLWTLMNQRNQQEQKQLQQRVVTFVLDWVKLTFTYYNETNVLDALFKLLDKFVSSSLTTTQLSPAVPAKSAGLNTSTSTSTASQRLTSPSSGTFNPDSTLERELIQRIVQYKLAGIDPRNLVAVVVKMKHNKYGVKTTNITTSFGHNTIFQGSDALKWLKKHQEENVDTPHASFFKRFQSKVDGLIEKAPISSRNGLSSLASSNSSNGSNTDSNFAGFLEIDNFEVLNQLLLDKLIVQVASKTGEPRTNAEMSFNKKKFYTFTIDSHIEANALIQNIRPVQKSTQGFSANSGISSDVSSGVLQNFFCSISPDAFAKQLSLLEASLFQRIEPHELHYWLKGDKSKRVKSAPNLHHVIQNLNRMSSWVATEIVTTANPKQRIATLKRFILVAQYCLKYRNYQGLLEIMGGLNNTSVRRLTAWSALPEKYHNMYNRLSEIVNPAQNWKNYRPLIERESQACIPYVGLFLSDLTFINDSVKSELPDGRLNWKKAARLALIINSIRKMQRRAYAFAPDFQILKYLTEDLTVLEEKELFNQSRLLEPTRARSGSVY